MIRPTLRDGLVFLLLVFTGVASRVALQHVPNFAPVAGLALFAGYFFANLWLAVLAPLTVMAVSDRFVDAGGYDVRLMLVVYGLLVLPVFLRNVVRRYFGFDTASPGRALVSLGGLVGCSLLCSVIFFLGTNGAVWLTSSWYDASWQGLMQCLANGVPFFRYTAAGDALFALIFFGTYAAFRVAAETTVRHAQAIGDSRS